MTLCETKTIKLETQTHYRHISISNFKLAGPFLAC